MLSRNLHFLARRIRASKYNEMLKFAKEFWGDLLDGMGQDYGDINFDVEAQDQPEKVKEFSKALIKNYPGIRIKYHKVSDTNLLRIGIENADQYLEESMTELEEAKDLILAIMSDFGVSLEREDLESKDRSSTTSLSYHFRIGGHPGFISIDVKDNYDIWVKKGHMVMNVQLSNLNTQAGVWSEVASAFKKFPGEAGFYNQEQRTEVKRKMGLDPHKSYQMVEGFEVAFNEGGPVIRGDGKTLGFGWSTPVEMEQSIENIYKAIDLLKAL